MKPVFYYYYKQFIKTQQNTQKNTQIQKMD